jgi:hypothetical protein
METDTSPVAVYIHVQLRQVSESETVAVGTCSSGDPLHVSLVDMARCTYRHTCAATGFDM